MKIYNWTESSESSLLLLEEWKLSRGIANTAAMALHDALNSGNQDAEMIFLLTKEMEDAHKKAMTIFDRLQKFRLG